MIAGVNIAYGKNPAFLRKLKPYDRFHSRSPFCNIVSKLLYHNNKIKSNLQQRKKDGKTVQTNNDHISKLLFITAVKAAEFRRIVTNAV